MATLKGEGAFKGNNLIVHAPANAVLHEDKNDKNSPIKGRFLDVQVDQSLFPADKVATGEKSADTNPHLSSVQKDHPNGGIYVSHRTYYSEAQFQAITDAAGKKAATLENGDTVYGITADVMKNAKGDLIINTKQPMSPTNNPFFGKNVLDKQAAVTDAAKAFKETERAAAKEAPEAEATVEAEAEPEPEA